MKKNILILYGATTILAGCSIIYELVIARSFARIAGNSVFWYSLTIGTYLGALGIGAMLSKSFFKNKPFSRILVYLESLIAISGGIAAVAAGYLHTGDLYFELSGSFREGAAVVFVGFFIISVGVGLLNGFELPLLIEIGNKVSRKISVTNRILGADYFGSLLGSIFFALLLVPYFSTIEIGFLTAIMNILIMLVLFLNLYGKKESFPLPVYLSVVTIAILIIGIMRADRIEQFFLKKYYYYPIVLTDLKGIFTSTENLPDIKVVRSPYQRIDLVDSLSYDYGDILNPAYSKKYERDSSYPNGLTMYLNGDWQFYSNVDEIYHEYFVHVPIILNNEIPQKVLVLGGGDGMVDRELLKYSGIEKIVHIDLDKQMIDLARTSPRISHMNGGALDNPRVETRIEDALWYVRNTKDKYDAVFVDFPAPIDYNTSKLYSKEFYFFVKKRLNKNGFAAFDTPGSAVFNLPDQNGRQVLNEESDWNYFYNTLKAAGFENIIPYVSNLEKDNPQAEEILNKLVEFEDQNPICEGEYGLDECPWQGDLTEEQKKEAKESAKKDLIDRYVWGMQQGFIMAKNSSDKLPFEYHELGVDYNIINEERFKLAFMLPYPLSEGVEQKYVNSIMRPTLPNIPFWFIRSPY